MAVAFVLLVSVSLLGRSLLSVLEVNPGFDPEGVLSGNIALPGASYSPERMVSFYSTLLAALEPRVGARAVAIVDELPLTGDRGRRLVGDGLADLGHAACTPRACRIDVMRIPVPGRSFERRDDDPAPPRLVISRSLAERLLPWIKPSAQPLVRAAQRRRSAVVGDVKHRALTSPAANRNRRPRRPSRSSHLIVRSARADADVIAAVRDEVSSLDPNLPLHNRVDARRR